MSKDKTSARPIFALGTAILLGVIFLLGAVFAYINRFGGLPKNVNNLPAAYDMAAWGQLGDFFGGTVNPVFAFLSLMTLLYTVHLQTKQLELSREELKSTRAELARSADAQNSAVEYAKATAEAQAAAARAQELAAQSAELSAKTQQEAYALQIVAGRSAAAQARASVISVQIGVIGVKMEAWATARHHAGSNSEAKESSGFSRTALIEDLEVLEQQLKVELDSLRN